MKKLILLAEPNEWQRLSDLTRRFGGPAEVIAISTKGDLDRATENAGPDIRLVGFCTPVIVPVEILGRLSGPAYNFHPGPPSVRGIYPAVFALTQGLTEFGATLHEMGEEPDAGAIVQVERAAIPPDTDRMSLEILARDLVTQLFEKTIRMLLHMDAALPTCDEAWSGPAWSKADFEALCRLDDNMTEADFNHRLRAVGEGPDHALFFERFGRRFSLQPSGPAGQVVVGGQPAKRNL